MSERRIQEIKERILATTPGVWRVWEPDEDYLGDDSPTVVSESGQYIAQTNYDGLNDRDTMSADAVFIAHAKEDIAYLLSLIESE